MKIDLAPLREREEKKLIRVQQHPTLPLLIWNYTEMCQFSKAWDEWTLQARGLITDLEGNVVARPFKKFFNYEEHVGALPEGTPEIVEKVDGSLGIMFWYDDAWHFATRGSFTSEQAFHAGMVFTTKYKDEIASIPKDHTHLWEIVYPGNRIVVDYQGKDELVYLGSVHTEFGYQNPHLLEGSNKPWRCVNKLVHDNPKNFTDLRLLEKPNEEGFVLRWPNGFRLKIKFEEYKRLHRIMTGTSTLTIWEFIRDGKSLDELIDKTPDEFHVWVKETYNEMANEMAIIRDIVDKQMMWIRHWRKPATRKEWAEYIKPMTFADLMFQVLDSRDLRPGLVKRVRPIYSKPFSQEI